jgi:hypothetical protein
MGPVPSEVLALVDRPGAAVVLALVDRPGAAVVLALVDSLKKPEPNFSPSIGVPPSLLASMQVLYSPNKDSVFVLGLALLSNPSTTRIHQRSRRLSPETIFLLRSPPRATPGQ